MGEMSRLDRKGDTKIIWDAKNRDEVKAAKGTFDDLTKKGFLAYKVTDNKGRRGEQIREFDPKAERIILAPAMVGG